VSKLFSALRWNPEYCSLELINQLELPGEEHWKTCNHEGDVGLAIKKMIIRGAPAIGCAAAYGVAMAANRAARLADDGAFREEMAQALEMLAKTRPTAVNLFWALDRMHSVMEEALAKGTREEAAKRLIAEAIAIHEEDIAQCQRIGAYGEPLIPEGATVLTHCNTGALATGGYGTALGVIRAAHAAGKGIHVLADETRPYLQGSRLTAWELHREDIDVTVIPDSAAPFLLARGEIQCAIVGADRIAANGDTANKIGTYSIALAAHAAGVPFYVAAPMSTLDFATKTGAEIPIEERRGSEILHIGDTMIAPEGVKARYPAFDITPAHLITAIITDRGVARAPYEQSLAALRDHKG